MYPSSATTEPAGSAGEAAAAQQCRGCSAPLARAALGMTLMFGTAETKDLCAKCTRKYYYRTGGLGAVSRSSAEHAATCPFAFAAAATARPPPAAENQNAAAPRPTTNRCAACPKKVGLLGFPCRCGGNFCSAHRHADSHGCNFDYNKGFAREATGTNR